MADEPCRGNRNCSMKHIPIHSLCHIVVLDEEHSLVFGSPPEWIKKASGFPFPRHVFLGETTLYNGFNCTEVEFPIYKNYFFNKMRQTSIIAPVKNLPRLQSIVSEALLGPESYGVTYQQQKAAYFTNRLAVHKNFDPSEDRLLLEDYAQFLPYSEDRFETLGAVIRLVDRDSFLVQYGNRELEISLSYIPSARDKKNPSGKKVEGHLSLYCFDSGDGFSENKECTSFLLNIGGRYLIVDPSALCFDRLIDRGYSHQDIAAIFISHVHADHDQGLYRFLRYNQNIPILAGEIVMESLRKKIAGMVGSTDYLQHITLIPLKLGGKTGLDFLPLDIHCELGFHSIPSVMMKIYFRDRNLSSHVFGYSGDTLFDPGLYSTEGFNQDYRRELEGFFGDATILVHEGGAGLIHTDPEDLIPFLGKNQEVFWVHTSREDQNAFSRGKVLTKDQNLRFE